VLRNEEARERSEERAARNETAFRDANEQIDGKRRELGLELATPFLCECEDETCTNLVRLTPSEYEHARSEPRRFIVYRGHQRRDSVVEESVEYVLVEKSGTGGEIAEETAS
jgi:hypothetical protein